MAIMSKKTKQHHSFHLGMTLGLLILFILIGAPVQGATTEIHIVKYANDRSTVLSEKTLTYQQMRDSLPVLGDGTTHYYHQGPVFATNPDDRWNPKEDTNVQEKDMGAVKGTNLKDLCELVGGMSASDTLVIKASDGMTKDFAYKNVYRYSSREGPIGITWYMDGNYPDSGYSDGMRLVWFADGGTNPWGIHAFGNWDWHEAADPEYWYYYMSGAEKYPTTTGLSVKYVSEIQIYSSLAPGSSTTSSSYSGGGGVGIPVSGSAAPVNPDIFGYKGKKLNTFKTGILNGSVRFFYDADNQPVIVDNRIRDFKLTVDTPTGSNVTLARMYLYVSESHNLQSSKGVVPSFYATLNKEMLTPDQMYIDSDGDENGYVAATYAYDVRELLKGNGSYDVSVRNLDFEQFEFTVDGLLLVVAYENETGPATSYWIDEGCDVISSVPEKGLLPEDCETSYTFSGTVNMSMAGNASLYLVSTGLDQNITTEHTVRFNEATWYNIFDNRSSSIVTQLPVLTVLNETGNTANVQSSIRFEDADYLVNRNAIMVVEHRDPNSSVIIQNVSTTAESQHAPFTDGGDMQPIENESQRRQITLDTDPGGALVYVDGIYLGKTTPYNLDVIKGDSLTVRFELDGYEPSETSFIATNTTSIHVSLYAPNRPINGRLREIPEDPDGIRYGGLAISSRPNGQMISIDGISTGKATPSVIMGLEPGSHTIKLTSESTNKEKSDFSFEEQRVWVLPGVLFPVDFNGIGNNPLSEVILDSHHYRGLPFTVNGYPFNATVPAKARLARFDSFITIHENESFVSHQIPTTLTVNLYQIIGPRSYQSFNISVSSNPRGAEVFIDGFRTGYTTPYTFGNISDGPHRIMVTKDGYLPQQRLIDLPYGADPLYRKSVDFVLNEYQSGYLYVNSIPEGGKVSIDNLFTGENTPALFKSVPIGTHTIKVTGVNSSKTFYDVTVIPQDLTILTADFTPVEES
jgi:hypothetical protein